MRKNSTRDTLRPERRERRREGFLSNYGETPLSADNSSRGNGTEVEVSPKQPSEKSSQDATEMGKRVHPAEAADLFNCAKELQSHPQRKCAPGGELHPSEAPVKTNQEPK